MAEYKNPVGIRMPEALRARVKRAAQLTGRSMNAEICYRLEVSFSAESHEPATTVGEIAGNYPNNAASSDGTLGLNTRQQQALSVLLAEERARSAPATPTSDHWMACMDLVVRRLQQRQQEVTPAQLIALVEQACARHEQDGPPSVDRVDQLIDQLAA